MSIWLLVFVGGALLPVGMGVCLSVHLPEHQPLSSSIVQFLNNVLGYFLCPIVSGIIMDSFQDEA
jgi:hypothetical protein